MMRSKKKRKLKGVPEPEKPAQPQSQPQEPVLDKDGKPVLGQDGNPLMKIGQITIDVFSNMEVTVRNFPTNHGVAMMILANAIMKVSEFFVMENQKKVSPIMIAKPGASLADIEKMTRNN